MFTLLIVIVAACGKSTDESNASPDINEESTETPSNTDNTDSEGNNANSENDNTDSESNSTIENEETPVNTEEKEDQVSLKEDYVKKLNETKIEMDELRQNPTDSSTYAMKNAEGQRFDVWDGLLNEVYAVLKEQLPTEEMDQLREKQREWIKYRDSTALEASEKYKGGTQEQLEYTAVLNDLTEERCFELVEEYMK
ncbi:lysozyme inhibitor LprI family protein [Robertmurraya massiliosenegalensis]|uniref:lysozyme inhibitor LprI family protein n=1 Tax=Robertmurraya TaxID=2837507 RepID=UPI0039A6037C